MSREFIDVSIPLRNDMVYWPGDAPFHRLQTLHISNGDVCNLSQISTSAHIGTHMDAPRHFLADGKGMETMPIEATIGPARVIAIQHPELIQVQELEPHHLQKRSLQDQELRAPLENPRLPGKVRAHPGRNRPLFGEVWSPNRWRGLSLGGRLRNRQRRNPSRTARGRHLANRRLESGTCGARSLRTDLLATKDRGKRRRPSTSRSTKAPNEKLETRNELHFHPVLSPKGDER